MSFSSITFLFFFLPAILLVHFLSGKRFRNASLLVVSLALYAWGEQGNLRLLAVMIMVNYLLGLAFHCLDGADGQCSYGAPGCPRRDDVLPRARGWLLAVGVATNLGVLVAFKYSVWLGSWIFPALPFYVSALLGSDRPGAPLGISFFTFHALSYLIDVYRRDARPQTSLLKYGLYICVFPKMLAGPIQPYREAASQLQDRTITVETFLGGVERFITGLAKKTLLAAPLAAFADDVFGNPPGMLPTTLAWLGLASFTLQIYFDFSGYTDMAIGLGQMFGLRFPENFDYPYTSRSIRELWRRWHISLSRWFRDYLYIPLGGSQCAPSRQYANLVIVFLLCGLWHGASWNYVIWGAWHGLFLVLERTAIGAGVLGRAGAPLRHLYTLMVVSLGWVFFRCDTLVQSVDFFSALLGMGAVDAAVPAALFVNAEWTLCMVLGVLGSTPWTARAVRMGRWLGGWEPGSLDAAGQRFLALRGVWCGILLVLSGMSLAGGTHKPFIYFKF
ncbi:MAG: hypothetical protein MUF52_00605 [Syntrophobacteraceae bacterium]|jgi:alginate O-acetyltransferase complex protein AlgI|nr:hypothetical protein [Syntrophobacteraceae bacterium]